jgi:transposase
MWRCFDAYVYLGIDISKNTHVASLMDEKGKTFLKAFSFPNSTDGGNSY